MVLGKGSGEQGAGWPLMATLPRSLNTAQTCPCVSLSREATPQHRCHFKCLRLADLDRSLPLLLTPPAEGRRALPPGTFLETLKTPVKLMAETQEARPRPALGYAGCGVNVPGFSQLFQLSRLALHAPLSMATIWPGIRAADSRTQGGSGWGKEDKVSFGELFSSYAVKTQMPGGGAWAERQNNTFVFSLQCGS